MQGEREENDHKNSQSPTSHTKRSFCPEITPGDINIPLDLTVEILKKLPVRSLVMFQCVSKQWSTIIGSCKDFIDSIVTRSLAQPRCDLHFIFHHCSPEPFFFFSSTYHHKEHALSIPRHCQCGRFEYHYVRGLICCWSLASQDLVKIYNPTTRQSVSLVEIKPPGDHRFCFFGYDPVRRQYKVMCVINGLEDQSGHVCQVFTLGDPTKQWRNIQGIGNHSLIVRGVHINGTVYYGAKAPSNSRKTYNKAEAMLLSFNFRSEKFEHIKTPQGMTNINRNPTLVNYKGKLGCLCCSNGAEMWVMENAEKQEWSKTSFCLPDIPLEGLRCPRFSGVTIGGEIFIFQFIYDPNDPLYVYYYDPEQHSFRRTEIKATTPPSDSMLILGVPDHVENTMRL